MRMGFAIFLLSSLIMVGVALKIYKVNECMKQFPTLYCLLP